jgi:ABC-type bacteriocin/lantibiotic exporter with double-glycine peptidase domain
MQPNCENLGDLLISTQAVYALHDEFIHYYNLSVVKEPIANIEKEETSFNYFYKMLLQTSTPSSLQYQIHSSEYKFIEKVIKNLATPIVIFIISDNNLEPIFISQEKKKLVYRKWNTSIGSFQNFNNELDIDKLLMQTQKEILMLTAIPLESLFNEDEYVKLYNKPLTPVIKFFRVLKLIKKEIWTLLTYAVFVGLFSLTLPLGTQSLVGFVSSGQISTSVIILIAFILFGLAFNGALQIMQLSLLERIEQKIFATASAEIIRKIPFAAKSVWEKNNPTELMNRFFDVLTLQKSFSKLLLDLPAAFLQILFGLILLASYHSSFVIFGVILVLILAIILRYTGDKAIKTSLKESKYKYQTAGWMEQVAYGIESFRLSRDSFLPMQKTNYYVSDYLNYRTQHFRILIGQYISFIGFKILVTAVVLILGSILVINRQINLGQFVAAEIVIILILGAVEKLITMLDTVYDAITAAEKLSAITSIPTDTPSGTFFNTFSHKEAFSIKFEEVSASYEFTTMSAINKLSFEIGAGEIVAISGARALTRSQIINIMAGIKIPSSGIIYYNNKPNSMIDIVGLQMRIGAVTPQQVLIDGTVKENIAFGRTGISKDDIWEVIEALDLENFVAKLPKGIDTELLSPNLKLPYQTVFKLLLARNIIHQPGLLLLDGFIPGVEQKEKDMIFENIKNLNFDKTIVISTQNNSIAGQCNKIINI